MWVRLSGARNFRRASVAQAREAALEAHARHPVVIDRRLTVDRVPLPEGDEVAHRQAREAIAHALQEQAVLVVDAVEHPEEALTDRLGLVPEFIASHLDLALPGEAVFALGIAEGEH